MRPESTPPSPHPHPGAAEGTEVHPSWVSVRFNKGSHSPPGAQLVDSDIKHQHVVTLQIHTMSRQRMLHRTWWHEGAEIIEILMSEAQFAAAITSFGDGSARPATLVYRAEGGEGYVPQCADTRPGEIRQAIEETQTAATDATADLAEAIADIERLLDEGAGKKALREAVRTAHFAVANLPANLAFTAKSMSETVEKVVKKATYDIEAVVIGKAQAVGLEIDTRPIVNELINPENPS